MRMFPILPIPVGHYEENLSDEVEEGGFFLEVDVWTKYSVPFQEHHERFSLGEVHLLPLLKERFHLFSLTPTWSQKFNKNTKMVVVGIEPIALIRRLFLRVKVPTFCNHQNVRL